MRDDGRTRPPDLYEGHPDWWSDRGYEMDLFPVPIKRRLLIIGRASANVRIAPRSTVFLDPVDDWVIEIELRHSPKGEQVDHVKRIFSSRELASAFGLDDTHIQAGGDFTQAYGGDVAVPGKFIRFKEFLCIPGPSTGYDGDAIISIYLTEKIKDAVRILLGR